MITLSNEMLLLWLLWVVDPERPVAGPHDTHSTHTRRIPYARTHAVFRVDAW